MSNRSTDHGRLQAAILDWAGTTVDFGCFSPAAVFLKVFAEQGVQITLTEARGPMGLMKKDHIRALTQTPEIAARWQTVHGRAPTEADVEVMFQNFIPLQVACLEAYADPIPGVLDAIAQFRSRGLRIGSTTGYTGEMMRVLVPEAARRGYAPDAWICATDVPAGRPAPWMLFANMTQLNVYPPAAVVKIGDTLPDIAEGLNAGCWTIGLTRTGNELGLTETELQAVPALELQARLEAIAQRMRQAGAHYVVESLADCPSLLDEIEARLAAGEKP